MSEVPGEKPKEEPKNPPESLYDIPGAREAIEENIRKRGRVWEPDIEEEKPKKPTIEKKK